MSMTQVFLFHYVCDVTFDVTPHVYDTDHCIPSVYQVWSS